MNSAAITGLPAPPAALSGWPWTIGSAPLPDVMPDGSAWPIITIVTPSFNQASYLEHTIRSVLLQGYPRLELIVIDGGSADHSSQVIDRYTAWIAHAVSEADGGPADALNKGFAAASGDIFAFLNADDFYLPGCFEKVALAFQAHPDAGVVCGHGYFANERGELGAAGFSDRWNADRFRHGACVLFQPATFFRRSWYEHAGGFKSSRSTWDMQLWADMALAGARFHTLDEYLAAFRLHAGSITGAIRSRQQRVDDAQIVLDSIRGRPAITADRARAFWYRVQRFVRHPIRSLRQRLYFHTTLGRWSL